MDQSHLVKEPNKSHLHRCGKQHCHHRCSDLGSVHILTQAAGDLSEAAGVTLFCHVLRLHNPQCTAQWTPEACLGQTCRTPQLGWVGSAKG